MPFFLYVILHPFLSSMGSPPPPFFKPKRYYPKIPQHLSSKIPIKSWGNLAIWWWHNIMCILFKICITFWETNEMEDKELKKKNPATLCWTFIIIPFIMDSKLTWIFQDKCLIDYPENKRSLGILRLAQCPPLITVNRDVDQKKCHFLWRWTHGAFWCIGVGSKGAK